MVNGTDVGFDLDAARFRKRITLAKTQSTQRNFLCVLCAFARDYCFRLRREGANSPYGDSTRKKKRRIHAVAIVLAVRGRVISRRRHLPKWLQGSSPRTCFQNLL